MKPLIPAAIALSATALTVAACSSASPLAATTATGRAAVSTASASAQPETEAGIRAAATQFYALYAASQWSSAWPYLAPSIQARVSEATFTAVNQGCPSPAGGLARVIKSVTLAGSTAVVTETVAGVASSLGSVADAWQYIGGQWRISLSPSALAVFSHGSAAADIAAAKAAGDCASS
jgi:hypothetical protein